MAFVFDDHIFYHIPKTGGTYVRKVLQSLDAGFKEIGHIHCSPLDIFGKAGDKKSFCVVRHPLSWYESYYRYRVDNGWKPDHHIDVACRAGDFEGFIKNFIHFYRFGYVTSLYARYVPFVDVVLNLDNLSDQLQDLLKSWGYKKKIDKIPVNAGSKAISIKLSKVSRKKILSLESGVIRYLNRR